MFENLSLIAFPVGDPVHVFPDPDAWADAVAHELAAAAREAIAWRGLFTLALTGGGTPRPVYERMAAMAAAPGGDKIDWSRARIFFGDERAIPPDHPDSNFGMARAAWLGRGAVPESSVFRMEGESKDLNAAADKYAELVRADVPPVNAGSGGARDFLEDDGAEEAEASGNLTEGSASQNWPAFDVVLLGMGGDGHIASLFPGTAALDEKTRLATANHVPQQNADRLTLTYPVLNAARAVWMLVTGESKAERVAQALGAIPGGEALPVSGVRPTQGKRIWLLDKGAAGKTSLA